MLIRGNKRRCILRHIDEQRYLWLFRAFGIFLVISIFLNITLIVAFEKVSPQPKKEAFLITGENRDISKIYLERKNNSDLDISQDNVGYVIAKNYISQYIINRESIFLNRGKMLNLWGTESEIFYLSSTPVYNQFVNSDYYKQGIINSNRQIITTSITDLEYQSKSKEWIAVVKLKKTDENGLNPIFETKRIRIKSKFTTGKVSLTPQKEWENPLGFKITEYEYIK